MLYKVEQIAGTNTSVLVLGETGTGKELVARAVHGLSARKNRALVKVNCATLPANLIESEMFGHEKGAFTGAHSRHLGRFEVANGATLFLDEIGELPLELQPKLLRVIQDGQFERVGGTGTIKVDVRIVAATNRNLEQEVAKGRFREDLWYRLNVFPITMPPLRDRTEDIPLLVGFYVQKISKRMGKRIDIVPTSVMHALQAYHWPGNVRELENVLEREVINSSGPKLRLVDELKKPFKDLSTSQRTLEAGSSANTLSGFSNRPIGRSAAKTARLKPLGSTAAPCAPACANSISESHRFRKRPPIPPRGPQTVTCDHRLNMTLIPLPIASTRKSFSSNSSTKSKRWAPRRRAIGTWHKACTYTRQRRFHEYYHWAAYSRHRRRNTMKSGNRDEAEGKLHQVKGKIKEIAGQVSANPELEDEGKGEKSEGKVQEKLGQVKKIFNK